MESLAKILAVAAGGAFGAVARFLLNQLLVGILLPFPLATFLINVSGSLVIGFLLVLAMERGIFSENMRYFLIVGFLGAYTTFSTFEWETFELIRENKIFPAVFYVFLSLIMGLAGVLAGVWLARKF
jgi:CrcB protein